MAIVSCYTAVNIHYPSLQHGNQVQKTLALLESGKSQSINTARVIWVVLIRSQQPHI